MGPARRHDASVCWVRGRQHARPAGQHVRPDGRLGVAQRTFPPATGRPERGPVARPLVPVVALAVAVAAVAPFGPVATMDSGREKPNGHRPAVLRRFSR